MSKPSFVFSSLITLILALDVGAWRVVYRDAKALQEKAAKKAAQAAVGGKASADHTKSHNKK